MIDLSDEGFSVSIHGWTGFHATIGDMEAPGSPELRWMRRTMSCLPLLLLPLALSGCITANTIAFATSEHTRYLHDEVRQVEKAALTADSNLVVWMDGKMAGADRSGKYTITASLLAPTSTSTSMSAPGEIDHAMVRRAAIVEGWDVELMRSADLRPVAVAPLVVLPGHQSPYSQRGRFKGVEGATGGTLYVARNAENDLNLTLVYVEQDKDRVPRQLFFNLETKYVRVPHRYYLLLWLPVTIPADAATLPLQLLMWPMMASIKC